MRDQQYFGRIQIAEFVMQLMTLVWASEDVTNTALYKELQRQNKEYLETIMEQNNEILKYLSKIN